MRCCDALGVRERGQERRGRRRRRRRRRRGTRRRVRRRRRRRSLGKPARRRRRRLRYSAGVAGLTAAELAVVRRRARAEAKGLAGALLDVACAERRARRARVERDRRRGGRRARRRARRRAGCGGKRGMPRRHAVATELAAAEGALVRVVCSLAMLLCLPRAERLTSQVAAIARGVWCAGQWSCRTRRRLAGGAHATRLAGARAAVGGRLLRVAPVRAAFKGGVADHRLVRLAWPLRPDRGEGA